ncbi:MAG: chromosome segregation protein SMC [Acidobacteriota bacterium]|nr:chromosome segregation protein SMC [Acidobacteriota bacterium]MDW3229600.1 chromosome segregation protein SMC [Acidobacteriota bacterium]
MFIKRLEVQGFKSFPERTKILFHPGITAIVGPNGTGKSNIVDAILWALGGLRLKSVRGDRTEDIIFNGNNKRAPLSLADVVLTLGNEEELVISHRVFRSGESEYRLNGKAVRLKDIQDELWKNSIGEKEYFVIEQGAIGSFVTSKPQEKRVLIEEAAGTAYYKDKKKQAQSKLESSEQNLIRLEDIIIEVEKSRNSLYRQALAAARYRRLRQRLRELTSHHHYRKMAQLDKALEQVQNQLQEAEARDEEAVAAIKEEEKELSVKRKELWDLEKIFKDRQEKSFGLKARLSRLESEIDRESKRLEYLEISQQKAASDQAELTNELKALEEEKAEIISRLSELEKLLKATTLGVEEKRTALEQVKKLVSGEENLLTEFRQSQMQRIQETTETKNNFIKLEKELELYLRQSEKLSREKENYLAQKNQTEARIYKLQEDIQLGLKEKAKQEKALERLNQKLDIISQKLAADEDILFQLNQELEEASHQLQALEKIAEVEREGPDNSLAPGALGWFSELIEIPEGEAYLFDLFWKEEAKAQTFLLETFKQNLPIIEGKTVLLLSEQPAPRVPEDLLKSEGVLGLLKQKIRTQPGMEQYLEGLKEALIVRDILTAVNLWENYPQFNFITAAGDLLYSSGLLIAGQKKEGLFTLQQEKKRLIQETERFETEKTPLIKEIETQTKEKQQLEESILELRTRIQETERQLSDLERENKFVNLELQKTVNSLEILAKEEKIQKDEKDRLQQRKEAALTELQKAETALEEIREKIRQKEESLRQLKEKQRGEEDSYYRLRSEFNLLQEKINSTRSNLQSLEKRHQAIASKRGVLEMDVLAAQEEKERLGKLIEELKQEFQLLETEARQQEQSLLTQDQQVQQLQKQQEELEARLKELRENKERFQEEKTRLEIRQAEIERDRLNLEETCWQELKKNLLELREEIEGEGKTSSTAEENEELAQALSGEVEESEEESEDKTEEKPKDRKRGKTPPPARDLSDEDLEKELEDTRDILQRYRQVNMMAEEEYLEQKKRYDFLIQQRQDLRDSINSTQEAIKKIDQESKTQFLKALEEVNRNFQEIFALLFQGGTAEVKLLDPENPLESGVEIVAQPPGKRVQNLALLSGGEKSLTSLAFLFALFQYKPSPFCILDEVDAALDEVNLTRFLHLMKAIKHQTQFIIVTHNYKTMEVADFIYGTTMEEPNVTRIYSVRMERKEPIPPDEELRLSPNQTSVVGGKEQSAQETENNSGEEPVKE